MIPFHWLTLLLNNQNGNDFSLVTHAAIECVLYYYVFQELPHSFAHLTYIKTERYPSQYSDIDTIQLL